jgi:hypothetical protein
MAIVPGPVNGATVTYRKNRGAIYWSWSADDNIAVAYKLFRAESGESTEEQIASGTRPAAVHVDFGTNGLDGDRLRWKFLCKPLSTGTFPVYVQFFQGTEAAGYSPVSDVYQYDVKVGPGAKIVEDFIVLREAP